MPHRSLLSSYLPTGEWQASPLFAGGGASRSYTCLGPLTTGTHLHRRSLAPFVENTPGFGSTPSICPTMGSFTSMLHLDAPFVFTSTALSVQLPCPLTQEGRPWVHFDIMPKRRRGASAPDFRKLKRKVGKRIPKSANEVTMDLRVKHVHMPVQRMLQGEEDDEGGGGGASKYTFDQLLARTRHTNAHARREAVESVAATIVRKPELLNLRLKDVVEALAERMADSEAPVRKAMNVVFEDTVLRNVDEKAMAPFIPLLVAHIAAAMTDIHRNVRLAALPVVEMLVRHSARNLVPFATPFLEQYNEMLTRGNRAKSVSAQNVESILKASKSLDVYVDGFERSLHAKEANKDKVGNSVHFDEFNEVIAPARWKRKGSVCAKQGVSYASTGGLEEIGGMKAHGMWITVGTSLLDCWMECTPSEVSTAPNQLHIESLESIARLLGRIVRIHHKISSESNIHASNQKNKKGKISSEELFRRLLVQRVIAYFPFAYPQVVVKGEILEAMSKLNSSTADLLCSLVCISDQVEDESWKQKLFRFFPTLISFYCDALSTGQLLKSDSCAGVDEFKTSAEAVRAARQSLFANLENILKFCRAHDYHLLLENVTKLLEEQHECTESLLGCLGAIGLLTSPAHAVLYGVSDWHVRWAQQMPQIALKVHPEGHTVSSMAVEIMSKIIRWIPSDGIPGMEHILCSMLVSCVSDAPGAETKANSGPIIALSSTSQVQIIDAVYYLPTLSRESFKLLATFCLMRSTPYSLALRLLNVLKFNAWNLDPNLYVSFLFTVLIGRVQGMAMGYRWDDDSGRSTTSCTGWGEEKLVVEAASSNLASFLSFRKIIALMEPQLLDCACREKDIRKVMGILLACSVASDGTDTDEEALSSTFASCVARVLPWYCTNAPDASSVCRGMLARFEMMGAFFEACMSLRIPMEDPQQVEHYLCTLASIFQDVAEDQRLRTSLTQHKEVVLAAYKHLEDRVLSLGEGTVAAARCGARLSRSLAAASVAMGQFT